MASGPPTYGNVATMVKNKGIRNNIPRWTPSVSPPPRKTALHMAAARNDIEELVSMIGTKLSLGDTKFVPEENTNTCTIEAENTIDVNTIGPFRQTALHVATLKGRIQATKTLLDAGADPEISDCGGWVALHFAAKSGVQEIVDMLVSRNADVFARDTAGRSALHIAARAGHTHVIRSLIETATIDPNILDNERRTPLHYAVMANKAVAVMELLALNADVSVKDAYGNTPAAAAMVLYGARDGADVPSSCGGGTRARGGAGERGVVQGMALAVHEDFARHRSVRRWKQSQLRFPRQPLSPAVATTTCRDLAITAGDVQTFAEGSLRRKNTSVGTPRARLPPIPAVFDCFGTACDERLFRGTWLEHRCFICVQTILLCLQRLRHMHRHTRPVPVELILLILRQMSGLHFYDRNAYIRTPTETGALSL